MAYLVVPDGKPVKLTQKQIASLFEARKICDALTCQNLPEILAPGKLVIPLGEIINHFAPNGFPEKTTEDDKPDADEKPEPPPNQETRDGSTKPKPKPTSK